MTEARGASDMLPKEASGAAGAKAGAPEAMSGALNGARPDLEFLEKVSLRFARAERCLGMVLSSGERVLACVDPNRYWVVDRISCLLQRRIRALTVDDGTIRAQISRAYHESAQEVEDLARSLDTAEIPSFSRLVEMTEDVLDSAGRAPVVKLVNAMLLQAIRMRASDIHVQPTEKDVQVRFRVDGVLYDIATLPMKMRDAATSRMKVMARMDIAERRLPQDGGYSFRIGDREIDVRASCLPTRFGERMVYRLQDKSLGVFELDTLGLEPDHLVTVRELIRLPHGIIFVTGPTGSGKTTTLYACLAAINSPSLNIVTIEDPIEYHLRGISQTEVSEKKGLTFATGLRSIVRQDPDVIMVGEVRDLETARIAIQSAMTGHLVFSTLHTNDSAGAVTRLLDLGIEPYLVASSLVAAVAQRLVRKVCLSCRRPWQPTDDELSRLGFSSDEVRTGGLYQAGGCAECFDTGYLGRTAIYEILVAEENLREQIGSRSSSADIRKEATTRGLRTLRQDGLLKALAGTTALSEVERVTQADAE